MPLNTISVEKFSAILENEYQLTERLLSGTTNEVHGVVGKIYNAPFASPWDLVDRGAYHSNVQRVIAEYRSVPITMEKKTALVANDIFEQSEVLASELQNFARQAAAALSRAQDQIILNAMIDSTPDETVGATSNLTVNDLVDTKKLLDKKAIPNQNRFFIGTEEQQASLLKQEKATSADYATVKALARGEIDTYLGFKFIWVPTGMTTGGLPISTSIRKCYAFHMDALTTPYAMEPSVSTDWDTNTQSYLVVPKFIMGSKVVRTDGIVLVNCTEA